MRKADGNLGALFGALLPLLTGGGFLLSNPRAVLPPTTMQGPPAATPDTADRGGGAPVALVRPPPAPPASATAQCLARFAIALPMQRGAAVAQRETLICRRGYVLALNADTHDPDWVMEHLGPADLKGRAVRTDAFRHDPQLPDGADASDADYFHSDYDRGHQAPAGDAKFAQPVMNESFYFSNMAPQVGIGFNRGAWKSLEQTIRDWVTCGGHPDLHVITGPIYGAQPATIGVDRVAVPRAFFKIVYDGNSGRAVGFVLPNRKIGSRLPDLQAYVKPIAWIETETGLVFFRSFDQRRQAQLKESPGSAWGHVATCSQDGDD